jgi:uncharacterized protein (DUF305 family)
MTMKTIWRTLLVLTALTSAVVIIPHPARAGSAPVVSSGVNAELTFIDLMIPHHATVVAMSRVVLETGEHPD